MNKMDFRKFSAEDTIPAEKLEQRAMVEDAVEAFLARGGSIKTVPTGVSGEKEGRPLSHMNAEDKKAYRERQRADEYNQRRVTAGLSATR